jgi:hypothetical protein
MQVTATVTLPSVPETWRFRSSCLFFELLNLELLNRRKALNGLNDLNRFQLSGITSPRGLKKGIRKIFTEMSVPLDLLMGDLWEVSPVKYHA